MKWSDIDKPIANINQMLIHGGIMMSDWFSDKLFMAFNISMVTKTDRAMVIGCGSLKTSQSMSAHSAPPAAH